MVFEQDDLFLSKNDFSALDTSQLNLKDETVSNINTAVSCSAKKQPEDDFIIKEQSHDEVDLQIQFNRVMYVLKRAIEKIRIVSYIPSFIKNDGEILKQYLDDDSVQFILDVCEKDAVLEDGIGQRSVNLRRRQDSFAQIQKHFKTEQSIIEVISLLYNNNSIKKDILEGDNIDYCEGATKLIDTMNMLYSACEQKLNMTAAQEKRRQEELRKAWRNNLVKKEEIEKLQKRLNDQRQNFAGDIFAKKIIILDYQEKLEAAKEDFKEKINKRVAESEKLMGLEAAASERKIGELTIQAKQVQSEYQTLLESHITYEKAMRAKRLKVETQLATWLAKYDQDIGERHYEIEALTKAYDEEKAEMDALQEKLDEQEDEYDELMEEKEAEDRRIYEINMYRILGNIAARKIQRCWRRHWARKQARIKARKARAKDKKMGKLSGAKKGKKKKAGKDKSKEVKTKQSNMAADMAKMAKTGVLDDLTTPAFDMKPVSVDL